MGWFHHSWRFEHAEALRKVGPEMPERGWKTSTVAAFWATFGILSARSKWFPVAIGDTMDVTWLYHYNPETKQQWSACTAVHPTPKISECKNLLENSRLDLLGSRRHPPHWLFSKRPNYQRRVLLISADAIEGHLKEKGRGRFTKGVLFFHDKAPSHRALANQKKWFIGFPVSWSPTLFSGSGSFGLPPGLWTEKQLKGRHFSSDAEVIVAAETWLDRQPSDFLSDLQNLEQRVKKCIELYGEYVE